MSVGKLEEASAFLKRIAATPYSTEEKIRDTAPFVAKALIGVFINPFLQPFGVVRRIYRYLFSHPRDYQSRLLTSDIIANMDKKYGRDKFNYIIEATDRLAKKMGIGEVKVALGEDSEIASHLFYNFSLLELGDDIYDLTTNEETDFVVAHELSHIKHKDGLKDIALNCVVLVSKLVVFRFFSTHVKRAIGFVMLTQLIADFILHKESLYQEGAADQGALCCLNSNTGMVQYCQNRLKDQYEIKHASIGKLKQKYPSMGEQDIRMMQRSFTPHGELRANNDHPSWLERLTHGLSFAPKN